MIGKWPVNQVEVEVIELEISYRLLARGDNVAFAVPVVPKLGGDPEFFAAQSPLKQLPEHSPDPVLIAIHRCAVEVPVSDARGVSYRFSHNLMRDMV